MNTDIPENEEKEIDIAQEMEEKRIAKLEKYGIDEEEVLKNANQYISNWTMWFNDNIQRAKEDTNFVMLDQWTPVERNEFTRLFKPALQFNKLRDPVRKVLGEQRKDRPDFMVRSINGKATQAEIELRADILRTICYQSQTDLVYQTAGQHALLGGFGCFEAKIEYESNRSFRKIIRPVLTRDPFRSGFDPLAILPHKGDGNLSYCLYEMSREEFRAKHPNIAEPSSFASPNSLLDFYWATKETVIICDIAIKEWFPVKIYELNTGETVTEEEWKELQKMVDMKSDLANNSQVVGGLIQSQIPKIARERQSQDYKIYRYHLIQDKIIDVEIWPSKQLPHIFVDGASHYMDGKQYTHSFIEAAKDSQRFVNYMGSEAAAEAKNRRREQWLATPDNIAGQELMWRNAELQMGALIANPDPKTGLMPQKMPAWELSQMLLAQYQRGVNDIKECLGFFEEAQGQQSNAISGIAVKRRQLASSMASYMYDDNLHQAIEQLGRVVIDLLPVVYGDKDRLISLKKQDGTSRPTMINQTQPDGNVANDLTCGEFDVEIAAGPSFAVQKEAAMEIMMQMVAADPQQILPLVADLLAKNTDLECTPQLTKRLQTLVPPNILAEEQGLPPPPPQPDPQQMAMQQQMQEHMMNIEERSKKLEIEQHKLLLDAVKLQQQARSDQQYTELEEKKAHMNYAADIAKIVGDLKKHQMIPRNPLK